MGNTPSSSSGSFSPGFKGLHVLRVAEHSPAQDAGIEPFFDYIVGIDGVETDLSPESLVSTVETYESRPLSLLIYSSKRQETRAVTLVPSRSWSTAAHAGATPAHAKGHGRQESEMSDGGASLLGLSLRFCTPEKALENVWHVLEILEDSPAESAGLVPYGDWIIGWAGGVLKDENDFYDVVEGHVDQPLRLYVYSYDFDTLREVVLVPNRQWGGEGLLGCGIGYGLLHRIPKLRPEDETLAGSGAGAAVGGGGDR